MTSGVLSMVLSALFFSLMNLQVKLVGARLATGQILLVRGGLTLAISYLMLRQAGVRLWGTRRRLLWLRGLLGFGSLACLFYALIHLPLAEATVLQYLNPVFTAVLAAWLLSEPFGWTETACVGAALAGVVLVTRPAALFGGTVGLDPLAVAVAIIGAGFAAGAYVDVRLLGRSEHPWLIVFYLPLVTTPAAVPLALADWKWPTGSEWLLLLGIGLTAQVAQIFLTRGLQREPAGRAMTIAYLQVVFAAAWGALFLGERPPPLAVAGAILILGSAVVLAIRTRTAPPAGSPPA